MKIHINQKLIEDGYVSKRKHPEFDYFIYNYTPKTQYEKMWNKQTLMCRGLILDDENNIIARPFKKFFNLEEYGKETHLGEFNHYNDFDVFDKADGSLGILYHTPTGEAKIATRGSFESQQAIEANKILEEKYSNVVFSKEHTYLFEILYPENRIVIDYGDTRDLILLAIVDNYSGVEMDRKHDEKFAETNNIKIIRSYNFNNVQDIIDSPQEENREGYVLRFGGVTRVKIKFDEYIRLHRIITGLNEKSVWEMLISGDSFEPLLVNVPDEFYKWLTKTRKDLQNRFDYIESMSSNIVTNAKNDPRFFNRKELAEHYKQFKKYLPVIFLMHDGKAYKNVIWKMIKPIKKEENYGIS